MPINLSGRPFLRLLDFSTEEIEYLLKLSKNFKDLKRTGTPHRYLEGKNIVLLFEKTSTRTRCAFEVAAYDEGGSLSDCLALCLSLEQTLAADHPYARSAQYGHLTARPCDAGSGLRASLLLHLPMLTAIGQMDRIIGYAGSRGCAVRGTYGEGSQAVGGFYQVSNQVTLGASAAELTDKLVETATTIIDAEKKAREQVRSQNEPALRDRIYRAAGTMKSAYLIDTSEAVQCISDVLIGLQMGFLSGMDAQKLYTLEEHIRPAMLTGAPQDRDRKRAEMLREATAGIRFA